VVPVPRLEINRAHPASQPERAHALNAVARAVSQSPCPSFLLFLSMTRAAGRGSSVVRGLR